MPKAPWMWQTVGCWDVGWWGEPHQHACLGGGFKYIVIFTPTYYLGKIPIFRDCVTGIRFILCRCLSGRWIPETTKRESFTSSKWPRHLGVGMKTDELPLWMFNWNVGVFFLGIPFHLETGIHNLRGTKNCEPCHHINKQHRGQQKMLKCHLSRDQHHVFI